MKFEKVSLEQFIKDCYALSAPYTEEELTDIYNKIKLPTRSDPKSAGYDFYSPFSFSLDNTSKDIMFPTGVQVILDDDKFLMCVPRSGLGCRTGMSLANTVGIIDASYSSSSNQGHIMAKLVKGFAPCHIQEGDRFMQGIILSYFITEDDQATGIRNGGFGSSGK